MLPKTFGLLSALALPLTAANPVASQAIAIIEKRCFQCHGDKVSMAGLQLHTRQALLKGGEKGPVVQPGSAKDSKLIAAVTHATKTPMPPTGKLPEAEIAILTKWIDQGAPWPEGIPASTADPSWWSFRTPNRPEPPTVRPHPIDAFIVAKLQQEKLTPVPLADRRTLIRRAYLDLHGLPPTPEEMRRHLANPAGDWWECLIEELLASPRYGEKWGRYWLDLARYGDTSGFEQDPYILEGWRYRDYVIKSFNDDKPYDRFAKEQIAGDELWPDDPEARTGTGFYRVGPNRDMLFKVEQLNRIERLADAVDTTSSVFLGLSVACARCHDHKFDPIPQRDYYRMQAIFAPAVNDRVFLEYNSARFYDIAENSRQFRLRQIGDQLAALFKPYREQIRNEQLAAFPEEVRVALDTPREQRTSRQEALFTEYSAKIKISDEAVRGRLSQEDAERLQAIERRLVALFTGYGAPPMAPGIIDVGREAPRTYIALRGNPDNPGEEVTPGFLSCLGGGDIPDPPLHAQTTYRRKALAEWIASPDNPLFARVMVNRIWQFHFGQGLVSTPSDFGTRGAEPTHPELLDWLAVEFPARGWSIKAMHRLLMTSEAYRRSSTPSQHARRRDPANRLLSHFNRRRLDAEDIRDAILQAAGTINLKMGGAPVVPPLDEEELFGIIGRPDTSWPVTPLAEEHTRRSIYLLSRRTFRNPMFEVFDKPDATMSCPQRNSSTTPTQSLTLLNSKFMVQQARALALAAKSVEEAWWRTLQRDPTPDEKTAAQEFLAKQTETLGSKEAAWTELARALLNLNEFLYLE